MISIASLFVLLIVVVPILARKSFSSEYIIKSNPSMENTNLWAKFPGDLKSVLTHNFIFFDYDKVQEENTTKNVLLMSENITLDENIAYSEFKQGDDGKSIFFSNNRNYSIKDNISEKVHFDNINLGMFEALETMAYPPLYKLGINSIYYLTKKYFLEEDLFIKELFTYYIKDQINADTCINQILKDIPENTKSNILDITNEPFKTYSLLTKNGLFEWIKLLGSSDDKIKAAKWPEDIFHLDIDHIHSILKNDDCFLIDNYKTYKNNIFKKYSCNNEIKCSEKLLYKQLIDSSVISDETEKKIDTYKKLNDELNLDIYPFDKSPELNNFNLQVSFTTEQLKKFIDKNSEFCLLSLNNSLHFLHTNKTGDDKQTYYEGLTYAQINFLAQYFYKSLPNVFLYPHLNIEEEVKKGDDDPKSYGLLSKVVSNFLHEITEATYNKISNINLLEFLTKKVAYDLLKKQLNVEETDKICPKIYQEAKVNEESIEKICSDQRINFMDNISFFSYYQLYFCQNETYDIRKCNETIKNIIKETGGTDITDQQISYIVSKDSSLGKSIEEYHKEMKDTYKCSGECTNEYLLKIQFAKADITMNPLKPLQKTDGLSGWFSELKDNNYEIINILNSHNKSDLDFEEQDAFWIIDSRKSNDNELDINNSKIFKNKINFEREYMKGLINKKNEEYSSLVKLTNFLFGLYVFKENKEVNDLTIRYSSVDKFLKGNCTFTEDWIKKINDGNYYENFNPKLEKLTEFNFGFSFSKDTQNDAEFDYIGISTDTEKLQKRRFIKMNDLLTLNIKKTEYDIIKDSFLKLNFSLFNFEKLLDERLFSDGFQYDHRLDLIYYFDHISSRPLVFVKDTNVYYKERVECKKYVLDQNDLTSKINEIFDRDSNILFMTQKVNKPFMLEPNNTNLLKFGYDPKKEFQNYICVDPVTDMVVDIKLDLVYSINSRKYGLLNKNIELDAIYPLFLYSKNYEVDLNSYEDNYPGAIDYYEANFSFLIIGVIVVIFFSTFALIAFNRVHKLEKEEKLDLTEVIGDELGEGTEKLKSDDDPDIENNNDDDEIERLRVQNENENGNNNENENENGNNNENENENGNNNENENENGNNNENENENGNDKEIGDKNENLIENKN